jgi:hypothetical protein
MRQNFLSGTLLAGGRIEDALGSFFAVHFSGTIIFPLEPLSFHWNHYLSTGTIIFASLDGFLNSKPKSREAQVMSYAS